MLELLRTNLLRRRRVYKDHQVCPRLLVNEEHALAKPVRRGIDAGLGVQILRPTLFEVLVCVGKLTGREGFASAGFHYDAHNASSSSRTNHLGTRGKGRSVEVQPFLFSDYCLGRLQSLGN